MIYYFFHKFYFIWELQNYKPKNIVFGIISICRDNPNGMVKYFLEHTLGPWDYRESLERVEMCSQGTFLIRKQI